MEAEPAADLSDMIRITLLFLTQVVAEEAERVHTAWGAAVVEASRTASRRALQSDSEQFVLGGNGGWGNWASQDDRVMGGVSVSTMVASGDDAIFSGTLRLESNGGFTSVRTSFRKDLRAYDGLRVNFFPSSRRLLMYLQLRAARSVLCSRSLIPPFRVDIFRRIRFHASPLQVPPSQRCQDGIIRRRDVCSIDQRGRREFRGVCSAAVDLILSAGRL